MNFEPLRRLKSTLSVAFVAAAALVMTSCGGGGATSSPVATGALALLPGTASFYAGVPYTLTIAGGLKPYLVTSSEQTLVELGYTTSSNEITIVARNPGVVDVGLDPNEVPRRSVTITVRDSNSTVVTNTYSVLQNFFTGYTQTYASTCASGTGAPPQACSGTDSLITLIPTSNGALYGNREFQLDRVRGDYSFVVADPTATPQLVGQLRVRTDQTGRATVRIRVNASAPTQLAQYKVTDVSTGVTTEVVFLIVQQPVVDTITVVPSGPITFTGSLSTRCGSGSTDVFVSGGTPPYSVQAASGLAVSPTTLAASGDRLSITVGVTSPPCPGALTVLITDSRGASATVTINSVVGSGALPTLSVAPSAIASLLCGQSAQVTVVGGSGSYSATSAHPRVTAIIAGNTLTLTRLAGDGATVYPTAGSASVTDGSSIVSVGITATPANCP